MIREQKSFCRICLALCGTVVKVHEDETLSIRGDPEDPLSHGYVCTKGRSLAALHHANRLTTAQVRRDGRLEPVGLDLALESAADALRGVLERYGPSAIATFSGGGAFADPVGAWAASRLKSELGITQSYSTASVDVSSKLLVALEMAGTLSLMPQANRDPQLLLVVGSNPVVSHGHTSPFSDPINRIRRARSVGEVWVVDPRRTETAALADQHLAIRPGTDHVLLAYLVRELLNDPHLDRRALGARADGVTTLQTAVAAYDLDRTRRETGLESHEIRALARSVRRAGRLAILTGTGTTMARQAYLTEWMAWALLILTDSFDQPGGMWFNPGFYERLHEHDRLQTVEMDAPSVPSRPETIPLLGEWPASLIPTEIEAGRLRGLMVIGSNPAVSLPNTMKLERTLADLDFLMVFDCAPNATTDLATHVFACADQLERPDVPSLDLLIGGLATRWTDAVVPASADAPEMWRILAELGEKLGVHVVEREEKIRDIATEDLMTDIYPGLDVSSLREAGGCVVEAPEVHGWASGRLPYGRWRLAPQRLVLELEAAVAPPSLQLTPRRQVRRINGVLYREGEPPNAVMNPRDLPEGVRDGDSVEIVSRTGRLVLPVTVSDDAVRGMVSIPHGWREANVNGLIDDQDLDGLTGMPLMSGTAVEVRRLPSDEDRTA